MVCAMGLGGCQAGRSHECDYPEWVSRLPVCTRPLIPTGGSSREIDELIKGRLRNAVSVYEVFPEMLARLRPTHILTQVQCEVCAVSLKDLQAALAGGLDCDPRVVPLNPNSLRDVFDDARRIAASLEEPEAGERLVDRMRRRMDAIARQARRETGVPPPRVACIEWLEPLMAAGNWVPELVEMAGGVNLFGEPGRHSPWMRWEDLVQADPDVIVVMACGWDEKRARGEMHWLTRRPEWGSLRAVRAGRVHVADGNQYFNRPGPRLVESLELMAGYLRS
jgi:iron complex transport system substrate-binding protein